MDLFEHFRTIWRLRWRVLAASLLVSAVVLAWSLNLPPVYQATALVAWVPGPTEASSDRGLELALRRYQQLVTTRVVLADAVRRSRLPLTVAGARERSRVAEAEGGGGLLALTAIGPSRGDAQQLAQGLARALEDAVAAQQAKALEAALAPVQQQMTEVTSELESVPNGSSQERALQA